MESVKQVCNAMLLEPNEANNIPIIALAAVRQHNLGRPPSALAPPPIVTTSYYWPKSLHAALEDCTKNATCDNYSDFESAHAAEAARLVTWCNVQKSDPAYATTNTLQGGLTRRVCDAVLSTEKSKKEALPISVIVDLQKFEEVPRYQCNGFGLTLPLFVLRYVGGVTTVTGPIAAGLGGGYYWAWTCDANWSVGGEGFVWSQGLDPSGNFQIGLAAGVSFQAFQYFVVGVDIGYDLFRQTVNATGVKVTNGLFAFKSFGAPSISYLLTLSFTPSTDHKPQQ